jgi:hypothetical protein
MMGKHNEKRVLFKDNLPSGHETLPYSRISNSIQFNSFCSRNPYLAIQPLDNVEQVTNLISKYVREREGESVCVREREERL